MNISNIPNLLSISRIFICILLFFLFDYPFLFFSIYILAGLSDVLDGFIARKYKVTSELGAKLDSIGDMLLFAVLITYLSFVYPAIVKSCMWLIILIFGLKMIAISVVFLRFRTFLMMHNIANKAAGVAVYLLPIFLWLGLTEYLYLMFAIAIFSAVEEVLIVVLSKEKVNPNQKSIFFREKSHPV